MCTFADIVRYYESIDAIKLIVLLGEVGNRNEIQIADMVNAGEVTKPMVARCLGESAESIKTELQFGHAGAKANREEEQASYKNAYMKAAGIHVPESYDSFGELI